MLGTIGYILIKLLPTVAIVAGAIYFVYVRSNPDRVKAAMSKYKEGTPAYNMWRKIHSHAFLVGWLFLAQYFLVSTLYDAYRTIYNTTSILGEILAITSFFAFLIGSYVSWRMTRKD